MCPVHFQEQPGPAPKSPQRPTRGFQSLPPAGYGARMTFLWQLPQRLFLLGTTALAVSALGTGERKGLVGAYLKPLFPGFPQPALTLTGILLNREAGSCLVPTFKPIPIPLQLLEGWEVCGWAVALGSGAVDETVCLGPFCILALTSLLPLCCVSCSQGARVQLSDRI